MKTQEEVLRQIDYYRDQLILAIEEKSLDSEQSGETDLIILSLIDKLEALLWVIDVELFEIFDSSYYNPALN